MFRVLKLCVSFKKFQKNRMLSSDYEIMLENYLENEDIRRKRIKKKWTKIYEHSIQTPSVAVKKPKKPFRIDFFSQIRFKPILFGYNRLVPKTG